MSTLAKLLSFEWLQVPHVSPSKSATMGSPGNLFVSAVLTPVSYRRKSPEEQSSHWPVMFAPLPDSVFSVLALFQFGYLFQAQKCI